MTFSEMQSNIEYDPKLQMQVPKEELERIKMENIILEQQFAQLKAEEAKVMLQNAINEVHHMMTKARIDQYGYIPDPDPWSDK